MSKAKTKVVFTKAELDGFEKGIASWGADNADKSLDRVYADDRSILKHILSLVRAGKLTSARQEAWDADTIVRDLIPKTVYDKLFDSDQWDETHLSAASLAKQHGGVWGEHLRFPVKDWTYEVSNNDTRLGYWEWVAAQIKED